ncbi:MAG TPA: primosomal protein N' [Dehalococcoidia bacterium]|nr:primosomal protein N' [Dehalococcoidia bacterium]
MPFADVAVTAPQRFGQSFSYAVPEGLALAPGDAVLVPFGSRRLPGIVLETGDRASYDGTLREVERRLGDEPLLLPHQVRLARWLAERYLAPVAAAVALALPPGTRDADDLIPPARATVPALRLRLAADAALRALALLPPVTAGRALRCVAALLEAGGVAPLHELKRAHGLTPATERALLEAGIVEALALPAGCPAGPLPGPPSTRWGRETRGGEEDNPVPPHAPAHPTEAPDPATNPREPLPHRDGGGAGEGAAPRHLTHDQQAAVQAIARAMRNRFAGIGAPGAFLLHGVTGSGKTEVYLAALEIARAHGRQGIVLVPEIALTPQTERRFAERFPGRVAVAHGRLSRARRRALWFAARAGEVDVVVGARSALFVPVPHPGLIVLDEEHEPSYKQSDPAPRYHAREAAAELARLTGAVLLLGSATPDLASYRRAQTQELGLLRLPQRVAPRADGTPELVPPPALQVVDMARELREGNANVLSRALDAALAETLAAGEQALLFLNRRGSASLLLCRDCGYAPRCPRCSVSYALHAAAGKLLCHHCRHSRGVPPRCPKCKGTRFRPVGIGTQRLEELVRERFPAARVLRWDGDTASTATKHAELAAAVAARAVDIVVGTQIIAKGHDFGGVTLVGVVSADLSLNIPDFRAAERTFQLLVQVAGRAGRRDRPGRVFVQTYAPGHYAIRAAAEQDYAAFYAREAAFRRQLSYPPFGALTRLIHANRDEAAAEHSAERYAAKLRTERQRLGLPGPEIVGPAPCYLSKLAGRYRWQILLRGGAGRELLAAVPPPTGWSVDVEPVDVL